MRKIIIIVLIITVGSVNAQMRGGGQQQQVQQKQKMSKFDAAKTAGAYVYDEEDIIKKLKIKDVTKQSAINRAVIVYNKNIDEIKFLNSKKFSNLNEFVKLKREEAILNRDKEAMLDLKDAVSDKLMSVKNEVKLLEKSLNAEFLKVLSKKHYKKWLKYQAKKKEGQKPKVAYKKQNMSPNSSRQRRGYGRQRNRF